MSGISDTGFWEPREHVRHGQIRSITPEMRSIVAKSFIRSDDTFGDIPNQTAREADRAKPNQRRAKVKIRRPTHAPGSFGPFPINDQSAQADWIEKDGWSEWYASRRKSRAEIPRPISRRTWSHSDITARQARKVGLGAFSPLPVGALTQIGFAWKRNINRLDSGTDKNAGSSYQVFLGAKGSIALGDPVTVRLRSRPECADFIARVARDEPESFSTRQTDDDAKYYKRILPPTPSRWHRGERPNFAPEWACDSAATSALPRRRRILALASERPWSTMSRRDREIAIDVDGLFAEAQRGSGVSRDVDEPFTGPRDARTDQMEGIEGEHETEARSTFDLSDWTSASTKEDPAFRQARKERTALRRLPAGLGWRPQSDVPARQYGAMRLSACEDKERRRAASALYWCLRSHGWERGREPGLMRQTFERASSYQGSPFEPVPSSTGLIYPANYPSHYEWTRPTSELHDCMFELPLVYEPRLWVEPSEDAAPASRSRRANHARLQVGFGREPDGTVWADLGDMVKTFNARLSDWTIRVIFHAIRLLERRKERGTTDDDHTDLAWHLASLRAAALDYGAWNGSHVDLFADPLKKEQARRVLVYIADRVSLRRGGGRSGRVGARKLEELLNTVGFEGQLFDLVACAAPHGNPPELPEGYVRSLRASLSPPSM